MIPTFISINHNILRFLVLDFVIERLNHVECAASSYNAVPILRHNMLPSHGRFNKPKEYNMTTEVLYKPFITVCRFLQYVCGELLYSTSTISSAGMAIIL